LGGAVALDVAAAHPEGVVAAFTLSGVEFVSGYDIDRRVIEAITVPMLFVAGTADDEAATSARDWGRWAAGSGRMVLLDTGSHGTDLLIDDSVSTRVSREILEFLNAHAAAD